MLSLFKAHPYWGSAIMGALIAVLANVGPWASWFEGNIWFLGVLSGVLVVVVISKASQARKSSEDRE
ncbi:MAG: hypothetical protein COB37_00880 [Kordiimonadales bacterium]|nr:MAG: hypothetical protein COB37_00880 [Kordiimonadales bacterium]